MQNNGAALIAPSCRWRQSLWHQQQWSPRLRPNNDSSCLQLHYPRSSPTSPTCLRALSLQRVQEGETWVTQSCQHNMSHRLVYAFFFLSHNCTCDSHASPFFFFFASSNLHLWLLPAALVSKHPLVSSHRPECPLTGKINFCFNLILYASRM